jgi:hypothetical protein
MKLVTLLSAQIERQEIILIKLEASAVIVNNLEINVKVMNVHHTYLCLSSL